MKKMIGVIGVVTIICCGLPAMSADFNGDGTNDIGIFRPSSGLWAVRDVSRLYFGTTGDEPVPGDYNGDGEVDIGLFRPSTGLWAVRNVTRTYFGGLGDEPLAGIPAGGGGGLWNQNGNSIYYDAGNVGIGTSNPIFNLDINENSSNYSYLHFTNTTTGPGDLNGVLVGIDATEDFRIHSYEANNIKLYTNSIERVRIDSDGDVGIGTTNPFEKLHVQDSSTGWYVAMFENTSNDSSAKLLRLAINKNHPGTSNEYIAFFQDVGSIGAIRGKGDGGVQYYSTTGDFAECLPRLSADEVIEAGDIVGLSGGKVSKITRGAEQVQVISSASIVLGNHPGKEKEHLYEEVAFVGQTPVKIQGPVRSGDYIVPSGLNDGTGIAIAPDKLTSDDCAQIVGSSWETSNDDGVKLVNISVGLGATAKASQQLSRAKDRQIADLTERLEALERMVKEGKR